MSYLQNKCNISRHFLKTSLHYRVKHKSLKCCKMLYQSVMTKLSTLKFFKHLKKHITLLTYLLTYPANQSRVYDVGRWGTVADLARPSTECKLIALLTSGKRSCQASWDILSTEHWVNSHWSSEAIFQIRRICYPNHSTIHKVVIIVRHSFVIKDW